MTPEREEEIRNPCLRHEGKGYKKGCPDCFDLNRPKDFSYEEGQQEDSWRERNAD
jgi:hypothetical protein